MTRSEAKTLIVNAYSNITGLKMTDSMPVDNFYILGVKTGNMTPEMAANKMINSYTEQCNELFKNQ